MTDLSDFKRFVKTMYTLGLSNTSGKPRCDSSARKANGNGLWAGLFLFAAAVSSSGVVKELYSKGEAAFVAEAGDKARVSWNQSGNSEAAKVKSAWFDAATKRAAAGGRHRRARGEAPASRLCRCASRWPWRRCSGHRCLALLRRPARETSQSDENAYYNKESRQQAHAGLVLLACRHRPLYDIIRPGCFWLR
jgi:hypothetical protein